MVHLLRSCVTELVDSQSFRLQGNGDIEVHIDFSEHSEGDCDDHRAVDYGNVRPSFSNVSSTSPVIRRRIRTSSVPCRIEPGSWSRIPFAIRSLPSMIW